MRNQKKIVKVAEIEGRRAARKVVNIVMRRSLGVSIDLCIQSLNKVRKLGVKVHQVKAQMTVIRITRKQRGGKEESKWREMNGKENEDEERRR